MWVWMPLEPKEQPINEDGLPDLDRLWDFDDPAATRKRFTDLVPGVEASGNVAYLLELLT